MTFDDTAVQSLPLFPADGAFQPVDALGDFVGQAAVGTWTLGIEDPILDYPLVSHDFTLNLTVEDETGSSIPEPAAGAMLLAGVGALWLRRRWRRGTPSRTPDPA